MGRRNLIVRDKLMSEIARRYFELRQTQKQIAEAIKLDEQTIFNYIKKIRTTFTAYIKSEEGSNDYLLKSIKTKETLIQHAEAEYANALNEEQQLKALLPTYTYEQRDERRQTMARINVLAGVKKGSRYEIMIYDKELCQLLMDTGYIEKAMIKSMNLNANMTTEEINKRIINAIQNGSPTK